MHKKLLFLTIIFTLIFAGVLALPAQAESTTDLEELQSQKERVEQIEASVNSLLSLARDQEESRIVGVLENLLARIWDIREKLESRIKQINAYTEEKVPSESIEGARRGEDFKVIAVIPTVWPGYIIDAATLFYRTTESGTHYEMKRIELDENNIVHNYKGNERKVYIESHVPGEAIEFPGIDYYFAASSTMAMGDVWTSPLIRPAFRSHRAAVEPNRMPVIWHQPVTQAVVGEPITIVAEIYDPNPDDYISEASLYYRGGKVVLHAEISLVNTQGNTYKAEIPGEDVTKDGIEYYITAYDSHGVNAHHGSPDFHHAVSVISK